MSILDLGRKQKKKEKKREKRNFPIKNRKKTKERKFPIKDQKKNRRNMHKGLWTRQHLNNIELSPSKQKKKGNHDLKWSSPFDCQPKSCVSVTCSPHAKQKKKGKGQTLRAKFPTKKQTIPEEKSY